MRGMGQRRAAFEAIAVVRREALGEAKANCRVWQFLCLRRLSVRDEATILEVKMDWKSVYFIFSLFFPQVSIPARRRTLSEA